MIYKIKNNVICLIQCSFLSFFFMAGCASAPSLSSRYEISPYKPDGAAISKNVILVGDNQQNHLYGDPIWMKSELVDKFVSVAVRPVQQDIFGQSLLRWVCEVYGSQYPVIHLGDANNISCIGEYEAFIESMSTAKKPWIMVPGNHDMYLLGNTHITLNNEWKDACNGAGEPMTKDKFIYAYLSHLQKQFNDFRNKYPDIASLGENGCWISDFSSNNLLKSVEWKIDKKAPWRSYIVQEIDLSLPNSIQKVSAILLDTNQFAIAPVLTFPNAGMVGDIQDDQLKVIEEWLKDNTSGEKITIFMGHHPFDQLLPNANSAVDSLRKEYKIPIYVSAHTHEGQYYAHGKKDIDKWLELNVESIVDWPIEFRTFAIHEIRDCSDKYLIHSQLYRIPDCWENLSDSPLSDCNSNWEAKPNDKDYYLSYIDKSSGSKKTQRDLMESLLYTYKRLLENVRSAEDNNVWIDDCTTDNEILKKIDDVLQGQNVQNQISLLKKLGEFDRKRKPENSVMRRDYLLWQAIWASKYDKQKQRLPVPTDKYIIYTKELK